MHWLLKVEMQQGVPLVKKVKTDKIKKSAIQVGYDG